MPSDDRLQEVLRQYIPGFETTYILIDALDECLYVVELIKTLGAWQCHLLVTSRKEQHITESMMLTKPMEIDMMLVDDDITRYIDFVIDSSPELTIWSTNEKDLIRNTMLEKAKGM